MRFACVQFELLQQAGLERKVNSLRRFVSIYQYSAYISVQTDLSPNRSLSRVDKQDVAHRYRARIVYVSLVKSRYLLTVEEGVKADLSRAKLYKNGAFRFRASYVQLAYFIRRSLDQFSQVLSLNPLLLTSFLSRATILLNLPPGLFYTYRLLLGYVIPAFQVQVLQRFYKSQLSYRYIASNFYQLFVLSYTFYLTSSSLSTSLRAYLLSNSRSYIVYYPIYLRYFYIQRTLYYYLFQKDIQRESKYLYLYRFYRYYLIRLDNYPQESTLKCFQLIYRYLPVAFNTRQRILYVYAVGKYRSSYRRIELSPGFQRYPLYRVYSRLKCVQQTVRLRFKSA